MLDNESKWWMEDKKHDALQWVEAVDKSGLCVLEGAVIEGFEVVGPMNDEKDPIGDGLLFYLKTKSGRRIVLNITDTWGKDDDGMGIMAFLAQWD